MPPRRWLVLLAAMAACHAREGAAPPAQPPVDADHDGVLAQADCDDANPAVFARVAGYEDADGDGVGAGALRVFCTDGTLPSGYVPAGTDCSPLDPSTWRFVVLYPDADGDGVGAAPRFVACLGPTLPAGASPFGWDVDDADPARQWTGEEDDLLALLF
jgi:hypothetical protein